MACLIFECPSQLCRYKSDRGIVRDLFERAGIQFPDDVKSLDQTVIALLGGKGQVKKRKYSVNPSQEASSGTSCHHCAGSDRAKCFGRLMWALPLSGG
jgi:hypothetical protein